MKLWLTFKIGVFHTQKLDFQFIFEKIKSEEVGKLGPYPCVTNVVLS